MENTQDFVIDTEMPEIPPTEEEIIVEQAAEVMSAVNEKEPIAEAKHQLEGESESIETPAELGVSVEQVPLSEPAVPSLSDIAALIVGLERKFDEKIAVDAHKNDLFDKLYKERDEYKNDIYGKLLKPFVTGAIQIITDLRMYISKMDTFEVERSLNYLKSLPDDIIELLENNGVELYTEEDDTFNPRTQRAKKLVETDDVSLNNKIAERLEEGFRWNGVVLRPEYVAVYKTNN